MNLKCATLILTATISLACGHKEDRERLTSDSLETIDTSGVVVPEDSSDNRTNLPTLQGKPVLAVHFADGSRLHGTPTCESISLKTSYAVITLQWKDLSSVVFWEKTLHVSLRNGDRLQGSLEGELCTLRTVVGDVPLNPGNLASIQVQTGVPASDMMAYYPLDGNALDESGNANHGTAPLLTPAENRFGAPNTAVVFDGSGGGITIASSSSMHPQDQFSVTFWIRVDELTNNYSPIFHKGGEVRGELANREYVAHIKTTSPGMFQFQFFCAGDGRGQHGVLSRRSFPLGQWLFVAGVFDRKEHVIHLYVNGTLEAESRDPYSTFNVNDHPLTLGIEAETAFSDHSPLAGALDELRFYDRALSREEIRSLQQSR
jgi:hypothetical protein